VLEAHAAGEPLFAACRAAGLALTVRTDIAAVQWGKLVINLNNAINALSGQPLAVQLADRNARRCAAACMREALAVLVAADIAVARVLVLPLPWIVRLLPMPDWAFRLIAKRIVGVDPQARSSMAEDFAAGRPTEVDYLQGEIVQLADRVHAGAPINRRLVELVHAAEAGGRRDYTGAELLEACTASASASAIR
jgi:2-dehydropantoate 2-reductase